MNRRPQHDYWLLKLVGAVLLTLVVTLPMIHDINRSQPSNLVALGWMSLLAWLEAGAIAGLVMVSRRQRESARSRMTDIDRLCEDYIRQEAQHSTEQVA